MDLVFQALGHAGRRRMLDILKDKPGCSVNNVCEFFNMSRIAVMKHLRVLEAANLIKSEKVGRTRKLYHNMVPIQMIYERWTTEYGSLWAGRLTEIKYKVERARQRGKKSDKKDGEHGGK